MQSFFFTRMWHLFKIKYPETSCTYEQYRVVFVSNFNLSFGKQKVDICSYCTGQKNLIESTADEDVRKVILKELMDHSEEAAKFHTLLKMEEENVVTISFDLMQNQVLPKTPIGEAYYSRQIYQYFLGVVRHENGIQTKDHVTFYSWGEYEAPRGANEIASSIYHYLSTSLPPQTSRIRLFCDACPGQNRNYVMLCMLSCFSSMHTIPISVYFPVRGHSYMPPDRVFGRVEQILRRQATILLPQEYFQTFKEVGQLVQLCEAGHLDWKTFCDTSLRVRKDFRISRARVVDINKATVQVRETYEGNISTHSLLAEGKSFLPLQISAVTKKSCVSSVKMENVKKLLKLLSISEDSNIGQFYGTLEIDE